MKTLAARLLIAVAPLLLLTIIGVLSSNPRTGHCKQRSRRMLAGALRGLSHGPQIRL